MILGYTASSNQRPFLSTSLACLTTDGDAELDSPNPLGTPSPSRNIETNRARSSVLQKRALQILWAQNREMQGGRSQRGKSEEDLEAAKVSTHTEEEVRLEAKH